MMFRNRQYPDDFCGIISFQFHNIKILQRKISTFLCNSSFGRLDIIGTKILNTDNLKRTILYTNNKRTSIHIGNS